MLTQNISTSNLSLSDSGRLRFKLKCFGSAFRVTAPLQGRWRLGRVGGGGWSGRAEWAEKVWKVGRAAPKDTFLETLPQNIESSDPPLSDSDRGGSNFRCFAGRKRSATPFRTEAIEATQQTLRSPRRPLGMKWSVSSSPASVRRPRGKLQTLRSPRRWEESGTRFLLGRAASRSYVQSCVRAGRFRSDSRAIQGRFGPLGAIRRCWHLRFRAIRASPLNPL